MAKKKKGKIAIPYLITFAIAMLLVGGAAFFIFNYFELGKEDELPELVGRDTVEVTYESNHTVLFVLDSPDALCPTTFALMRSVPKDKDLLFVGIPSNTVETVKGKQTTLHEVYERGGAPEAAGFVENLLDIEVDRYMKFDSDAFADMCDIMGGVNYATGVKIPGLGNPHLSQQLIGKQVETFLTFSQFPDGEMQRAFNVGSVLAAMVNQSDYQRIADNFELYFNTIINQVETNITAIDFRENEEAITYMFRKGTAIAKYSYMTGELSGDHFVMDYDFGDILKLEYFSQSDEKEESTEQTSEAETSGENKDTEKTETEEKDAA
ncbi:MAG: LCP family protein [Ruminococcus sp.]|nr:LCP family protein [Ruminococcus sp.]MBQ8297284.1 LCP family protein [Ruminococcus sp.]